MRTILTLIIAAILALLIASTSPAFAQVADAGTDAALALDAGAASADTPAVVKPAETGAITDWTLWVRDSAFGKLTAAALLSGIVYAINKARGFVTDRAGALQVAVLSLIGGVLSSIVTGAPLDPTLVESVIAIALTSIGGYSFVKKVFYPSDGVGLGPVKPSGRGSGAGLSPDDNMISGEISRMPLPPPPEK